MVYHTQEVVVLQVHNVLLSENETDNYVISRAKSVIYRTLQPMVM